MTSHTEDNVSASTTSHMEVTWSTISMCTSMTIEVAWNTISVCTSTTNGMRVPQNSKWVRHFTTQVKGSIGSKSNLLISLAEVRQNIDLLTQENSNLYSTTTNHAEGMSLVQMNLCTGTSMNRADIGCFTHPQMNGSKIQTDGSRTTILAKPAENDHMKDLDRMCLIE